MQSQHYLDLALVLIALIYNDSALIKVTTHNAANVQA